MKNIINLFDDLNWENATNYPDGTLQKALRDEKGGKSLLLKIPKGFSMPSHSHINTEQHFVLGAHEDHGPFESKEGALILVIWDK
jgi:anti-sigma factor ChrR (cupin superfamily)